MGEKKKKEKHKLKNAFLNLIHEFGKIFYYEKNLFGTLYHF